MQSAVQSVEEYLETLPENRKEDMKLMYQTVKDNLPEGFEEGMQYGMIGWFVPLSRYPAGYLNDPRKALPFVCLASQKNYMSLYLMQVYGNPKIEAWFSEEYRESGKKINMGKSCLRFKTVEDVPLHLISQLMKKVSVDEYIEMYERARSGGRK